MSDLNKVLMGTWIISLMVLFVFFIQWMKEDVLNDNIQTEVESLENPSSELITDEPNEEPAPAPEEPEVTKETIDFGMIGDVLLHLRIASYKDYSSSLAAVQPSLESLDYLIANQESPPTGPVYALSGYPRFSSPSHIIRDIQKAGVDMVVIANNHIVDKGEDGLKQVFNNLDEYNMPYVGVYKNAEDANKPRIIEQKGIKIGMLAYTYGTNGLYLPQDSAYKVNYINEEKMIAAVEAVKDQVDVVAVSMHWGPEYTTEANDEQKRLAQVLNAAGVDIIFGSHPHILQPYETLTNANGKDTHVFYSISNFFSTILSVPDSMIGGIASFDITKEGDEVTIGQPEFKATTVLLDADGVYRIYPLVDVESRAVRKLDWVQSVLGPDVLVQ